MQISIWDKDVHSVNLLKDYLHVFINMLHISPPQLNIYSNEQNFIKDSCNMDIVFLDIHLSNGNGIQLLKELRERNKNCIIFIITSNMEYLDEAMRFQVFRFLSKPIDQERLFRNLQDVLKAYDSIYRKFPVEKGNGILLIPTSRLIAVEAKNRKVLIHTVDGTYSSVKPLTYWLEILPETSFFQTHRSYIVNLAFVESFDHDLIYLWDGKLTAYLTRRKYTSFKNACLLYLNLIR